MSDEDDSSVAVIVFLRCPKPGHVKSRLARTIGSELACQVYERCAIRILKSILSHSKNTHCFIFYSVSDEQEEVRKWLEKYGCLRLVAGCQSQEQSDCLGGRILHAFRSVACLGYKTIAIVGTDIPDLTSKVLFAGIEALQRHRISDERCALLGPSIDGGFYMMILAGVDPDIIDGINLKDIEWSTNTVYEDTLKALTAGNYKVLAKEESDIPSLRDVDVFEDLSAWYGERHDKVLVAKESWTKESLEYLVGEIVSEFHQKT